MNIELANYLQQLPTDQSRNIWLGIIGKQARNGTVNVVFRDIMKTHFLTEAELKKIFDPKSAEKAGIIKIQAATQSFISINFSNKKVRAKKATPETCVPESPLRTEKQAKPPVDHKKASHTHEADNLPSIPVPTDNNGLILGPLPEKYEPSNALHRILVGDYCRFYKEMIKYKAALIGNHVENPLNPKITPYDGKAFKELAIYFGINGFNSEPNIRIAFQKIYNIWQSLPYNYQNYFTPAQINRNINGIYAEMIQLNKPKHTNRKDAELAEKIRQNQSADYSHMVRPGL